MRISIFGAGATGGHLAVRLSQQGHEVSVLARGAHLNAIRADGLSLLQGDTTSTAHVRASDNAADLGRQDLVVVTVKATGLATAASQMAPLIGPDTLVVFPQNGMTWWYPIGLSAGHPPVPGIPIFSLAPRFLALMRPDQVVPGIVYSANEVLSPGVIRNNSPSKNALEIGWLDPRASEPVDQLRRTLQAAGIASAPVTDMRAAVWLKLIGNASASSLSVATGNPSSIATDPAIREVFLRLVNECLAVAQAYGYPLAGRLDLARWGQHRSQHKPSLLQDYEQGRAMELGEMVLAPVAFARAAGLATPTLDAVAAIAARLAADRGLYAPVAAGEPAANG